MDKKIEIAFKKEDFERYFKKVSTEKTLYGELESILETKGIILDKDIFTTITSLNPQVFRDFKKGEMKMSLKSIVSICIAFEFSFSETSRFLTASGYSLLLTKKNEYAYNLLLSHPEWHDYNIETCNEYLKAWGIDKNNLLGSIERK